MYSQPAVIRSLIVQGGAEISKRDNYCVREASRNGNMPIVELLMEFGADIHAE